MNKFKMIYIVFLLLGVILAGCSSGSNAVDEPKPVSGDSQQTEGNKEEAEEKTEVQYYYTANEKGSISKIDAADNSIITTIEIEGSAHNVQVSPDGKLIGATVVPSMSGHGGGRDGH